ncbi:ELMO domain-containing protein 2 [Rhizoclosmatium sp. JEL0117]|nr:ELMO domain-containing protein 2 [Rhizoclosmatium sp. JEL0117]
MRYFLRTVFTSTFGPSWLLTMLYSSTLVRFVYAKAKFVHRLLSGTSELLRICSSYLDTSKALIGEVNESESTDKKVWPNARFVARIDACLLHSKELILERRNIEAATTTPEYFDGYVDRILQKKLFTPNSPQARLLKSSLSIMAASFKLMHTLNKRAATPYDRDSPAHEKKLQELWDTAMPSERLTSRVSKQWEKIGFQGTDPATDFRGMGLLGLDDLVYYAKMHPSSFQRVLKSSHHDTAWFSMAVVGINITGFTLALVRKRSVQYLFYKYGTSKDVYHEFYCYVFDAFEKRWTANNSFLTVMDFGRFFEEFQVVIEAEMERTLENSVVLVLDEGRPVFDFDNKKMA